MASVGVDFGLTDPASWVSTARTFGRWALGFGTPQQQMLAAAILTVFFIASSAFSLGATLLLAIVTIVLFNIGLARFVLALVIG